MQKEYGSPLCPFAGSFIFPPLSVQLSGRSGPNQRDDFSGLRNLDFDVVGEYSPLGLTPFFFLFSCPTDLDQIRGVTSLGSGTWILMLSGNTPRLVWRHFFYLSSAHSFDTAFSIFCLLIHLFLAVFLRSRLQKHMVYTKTSVCTTIYFCYSRTQKKWWIRRRVIWWMLTSTTMPSPMRYCLKRMQGTVDMRSPV